VGTEYDSWTTDGILEYYWGEHIHLGYYSKEERDKGYLKKNFVQAKYDFIDRMMEFGQLDSPQFTQQPVKVLDVGCGIGGTSRYLAKKLGSNSSVVGITLSPKQVERATQLAKAQGVDNASFQVMDALQMSFPDNSFDIVWACESGEHMPDKEK
jgi:MPBQ/MSBQ methyltransferase